MVGGRVKMSQVWSVLTEPVMKIHYSLFKHATWITERHADDDLGPEAEDSGLTAACFCKATENPGKKALAALAKLFLDSTSEAWGPVVLVFGPVAQWSQTRLRMARRSFCVVIGQLWRKLLHPWTQYPWKLAALVDPGSSPAQKHSCANELFADPVCCLDGFARKLRDQVGQPEALLADESIIEFLHAVFERVVPTSTFVERMFARLTHWSSGQRGPKNNLATLAAKHCNFHFSAGVQRWRSRVLKQERRRVHNKRPSWVQHGINAGKGTNGWNAFQTDFFQHHPQARDLPLADRPAAARNAWRLCTAAEKAHWARVARAQNMQVGNAARAAADAANPADEIGGPWNCGCASGFPLARHLIAEHCAQAKARAQHFKRKHNVLQPQNENSLEGVAAAAYPLFPECPAGGCPHVLPEDKQAAMQRLQTLFWELVLTEAPGFKAAAQEPFLLSFSAPARGLVHDVAVAFHSRRAPLQAALVRLRRQHLPELASEGVLFSLHCSPSGGSGSELQMLSESELFAQMAKEAGQWETKVLQTGAVRTLSRFDITSERCVEKTASADDDSAAAPHSADFVSVLEAFQIAHPAVAAKAKGGKRKRQSGNAGATCKRPSAKRSKKKEGEKDPPLVVEQKLQGLLSESSESEAEKIEIMSAEAAGSKDLAPAEKAPAASTLHLLDPEAEADELEEVGLRPGQEAASSSSAPPPPQQHTRSGTRPWQRRGSKWGVFEIAPIYSKFFKDGWAASCGMHCNNGAAGAALCFVLQGFLFLGVTVWCTYRACAALALGFRLRVSGFRFLALGLLPQPGPKVPVAQPQSCVVGEEREQTIQKFPQPFSV